MRSALTMLGVFIGVAALIAMVAIGQGANEAVRKQIESLGTNLRRDRAGRHDHAAASAPAPAAPRRSRSPTPRRSAARIPAVAQVGYLIRQQAARCEYANQNWTTNIQGVSGNYPPITNWQIEAGRAITADDQSNAALVALIGQTVSRQLFSRTKTQSAPPLRSRACRCALSAFSPPRARSAYGQDQDDLVMMPFTTAERKVLGVAAPSQQQTPLNWAYLPPPIPTIFSRA